MSQEFITVRPACADDVAFIFATTLRNTWYSKNLVTTLSKDAFMKAKHFEVEELLDNNITLVACLASDLEVILGYIVDSDPAWCYVKKAWRGAGVEQILHKSLNKHKRDRISDEKKN